MSDTPDAVDVRGLVKSFGDVTALDGFDLRIALGEIHGLVGPNGAGKPHSYGCCSVSWLATVAPSPCSVMTGRPTD
jgi:ABC-type branched-subunit amino acid transport system ATPase component